MQPRSMTYRQAVEWLESLANPERTGLDRRFARRMSLDATRRLMELLGDPHSSLRAVHIAGTKGKGSVAAMIEAAARTAGYTTGLFTSPHLRSWRERVAIDGALISEQDVARLVGRVRPAVEQVEAEGRRAPSFFEACTAMAFLAFAERDLDLCIIEVGLGGRLDATNVITPLLSVITTLGIDHAHVLGDTLEQIATEKAGISKSGVPVVFAPQQPEATAVIRRVARELRAPLRMASPFVIDEIQPLDPDDLPSDEVPALHEPMRGRYAGEEVFLRLPLPGAHQAINVGVVAAVCECLAEHGFAIAPQALVEGLENMRWPARVEVVGARPWLIVDCAHNRQSARALISALNRHLRFERLIVVLGVSEDKSARDIATELSAADHVILTQASLPRAMPVETLARHTVGIWRSHEIIVPPETALQRARELAGPRDAICVTGSVFLIADLIATGALELPCLAE